MSNTCHEARCICPLCILAREKQPKVRVRGSGDFSIGSFVWPGISKLIEECGEVLQVCGKLIGTAELPNHWDGQDLKNSLENELGDLQAAIIFVVQYGNLDHKEIAERCALKIKTFVEWHVDQTKVEEKP